MCSICVRTNPTQIDGCAVVVGSSDVILAFFRGDLRSFKRSYGSFGGFRVINRRLICRDSATKTRRSRVHCRIITLHSINNNNGCDISARLIQFALRMHFGEGDKLGWYDDDMNDKVFRLNARVIFCWILNFYLFGMNKNLF